MKRTVLAAAVALLAGALAGCSGSGNTGPTANPDVTSTVNPIACNYYANMAGAVETISATASDQSLRVGEAQQALTKAKSSMIELERTGTTLAESTALEMNTYLYEFGAYLQLVQPDDDVNAIDKTSPSPSPATTTVQSDILRTYKKIGRELGC